jgi:hypothetical protein
MMQEIDRDQQQAVMERVEEIIRQHKYQYEEIRDELMDMGFVAKEDNPGLAIWENPDHELFLLLRTNPDRKYESHQISTFEDMEGLE